MTMTRTMRGAPKGHTVETFHQGQTYDLTDSLADAWEASGAARPADRGGATEDKMVRPAEEAQGEVVETPKRGRKPSRSKPSDRAGKDGEAGADRDTEPDNG
ncbi:MAG: hypothetical protein ACLFU3_08580 [Dichotomicrobium sp.]